MPISQDRVNLLKNQQLKISNIPTKQTYQSGMFKNYFDYVKKTQKYPYITYLYRKLWKHNMVRIKLVAFWNSTISIRLIPKN